VNWKKRAILLVVFTSIFGSSVANAGTNRYVRMDIIRHIESGNNPRAWNKHEDGRGLYQINPVCLKEYNNFHSLKYTKDDLWNPEVNSKIAIWYVEVRIPQLLRHYKQEVNTRNIIICYNAGIRAVLKGYVPVTTKQYLVKYETMSR